MSVASQQQIRLESELEARTHENAPSGSNTMQLDSISEDLNLDSHDTDEVETDKPMSDLETKIQEFLRREWEKAKTTLPKLSGFSGKAVALDRKMWRTWKFSTLDPFLQSSSIPSDIEYLMGSVDIYVFCPHTFWPHYMSAHVMRCPACKSSDGIAFDGWSDNIREVIDLSTKSYIISRRYRHRNLW